MYSIGCAHMLLGFFHLSIHLGAHSISEHKELSLSFWQLHNLCCSGNVRLYLSSALLMACFQSFVTISTVSVTIFAVDFVGWMDKFWCSWNSWRRNSWVKGFVQKVPKKNGGKWVTGEATCPRSQLISGGAVSLGSLVSECRLLTLHCGHCALSSFHWN